MNASLCFYFDVARSTSEFLNHHKRKRTTYLKAIVASTTDPTQQFIYQSMSVDQDIRRASTVHIGQTMRVPVGPSHPIPFDLTTKIGCQITIELWAVLHPDHDLDTVLRPESHKILLGRTTRKKSEAFNILIRENTPTVYELRGGSGNDQEIRRLEPLHQRTPKTTTGTLCMSCWLQPDKDVSANFDDPDALKNALLATTE